MGVIRMDTNFGLRAKKRIWLCAMADRRSWISLKDMSLYNFSLDLLVAFSSQPSVSRGRDLLTGGRLDPCVSKTGVGGIYAHRVVLIRKLNKKREGDIFHYEYVI